MKKSFLDSLVGLKLKEAIELITAQKLIPNELPHNCAIIAIAVPNTVNVWVKKGVVVAVGAGDGAEVESDA